MNKKICLCCGKEIDEGLWHKSCIRNFFGGDKLPEIDITTWERIGC